VTTDGQRRREVLERARDRRRRLAAEREQQPLRRAMFLGGAIGLGVGVVLGALFWDTDRAGPSIVAVLAVVIGTAVGAALGLQHAHAGERKKARQEARLRDEERARRRDQAQRERRARKVVAAPSLRGDDDFLVPPGFYPDPDGSDRRRWWDGVKWTSKRAA
jgi:Protein of unknown function (DUF2510)